MALVVKNPPTMQEFNPWVEKIPWSRKWQPAPVFLPGKFHRQRSLVGYSPWGCREMDIYLLKLQGRPFIFIIVAEELLIG